MNFREKRKRKKEIFSNLKLIKRSNKIGQAFILPKVLNLNPRSIYNKKDEFETFVKEESIDLICMSESWEKKEKTLEKVIKIEDFCVISNVFQRDGQGGRPAIIANTKKYHVENLTQKAVTVPWGVEVVWAAMTPKNVTNDSKIQKIIVASIYSKPNSRKKSLLLDHIAQVYSQMNTKYKKGLHWILCGDTNDLKLDPILHMNNQLKQVVQSPTRLNPPRLLDPIITTLSSFYQVPEVLDPLSADQDCNGKPSDHKMVVMSPINEINNKPARTKKEITYRPFSEENLQKMREWIEEEKWSQLSHEPSAHKKLELLQTTLVKKYHEFFPEKKREISSDDQPFYTKKLEKLKRRKCREFHKHRKSEKWKKLNFEYEIELSNAKKKYYRNKIQNLIKSKPSKWFQELKKLTSNDQIGSEEIFVEEIQDLPIKDQAELIADKFAAISQEFEKLKKDEIKIPDFSLDDIPVISKDEVKIALAGMDTSKSNVKDDIPSKVLKSFAENLAEPVADVINASLQQGIWPDMFKLEVVTPIPKVHPARKIDDLRNISGLLNLNKIAEKIIAKMIISDMKKNIDPSQYANQKGLSIQHYLVKFLDRIHEALENNKKCEATAVLATLVDWKQAFPRQCPKLGIESFIQNGVRPSLIPALINYFQNRKMQVKWKGAKSTIRDLHGGGPQGSTIGLWEYLSQSNDNANSINESERFKFVDDLSFLEIISLLNIGMSSYNFKQHIPTGIPVHNQFIPRDNLKSQNHLAVINEWTKKKKMKLNVRKTKSMIFNFSRKNQFITNLKVDNDIVEVVSETKLLGTYITSDLKWDKNTSELVKKAYKRMQILYKAASFTAKKNDLKRIYKTFIRSILEHSAVVWHSGLTQKNKEALERVQKAAVKVIMGREYMNYENALKILYLENL